MPSGKIKIVVAGGQPLFRYGICSAIAPCSNMKVISEIEDSCVAVEKFKKLKADVIIIDGLLPNCTERKCAAIIATVVPAKVIILSDVPSIDCAYRLFSLGATGYLLESCAPEETLGAIQSVAKNEKYISQQIAQQSYYGKWNCNAEKLTPREREVLCFITAAYTAKQIASCLGITYGTVRTFKKRIREKLRINNDIDLTKFAIKNGFASLDL